MKHLQLFENWLNENILLSDIEKIDKKKFEFFLSSISRKSADPMHFIFSNKQDIERIEDTVTKISGKARLVDLLTATKSEVTKLFDEINSPNGLSSKEGVIFTGTLECKPEIFDAFARGCDKNREKPRNEKSNATIIAVNRLDQLVGKEKDFKFMLYPKPFNAYIVK
jgi:hypothetical protein